MIKIDNMTRLAFSIAMRAHDGQVDRAGNPYDLHPLLSPRQSRHDSRQPMQHSMENNTQKSEDPKC